MPLRKVVGLFLVVYMIHYCIVYVSFSFLSNPDLSKGLHQVDILMFLYFFLVFCFSFYYLVRIRRKNILVKSRRWEGILLVFVVSYLITFLLDPFHHNFDGHEIQKIDDGFIMSKEFLVDVLEMTILAPIFEELIFRNLLLNPFLKARKVFFGIVLTSLFFSLNHLFVFNLKYHIDFIAQASYFIIGVLFALLRIKYGLLYAIFSHFIFNVLAVSYANNIDLYVLDFVSSNFLYWCLYIVAVIVTAASFFWMYSTADDKGYDSC